MFQLLLVIVSFQTAKHPTGTFKGFLCWKEITSNSFGKSILIIFTKMCTKSTKALLKHTRCTLKLCSGSEESSKSHHCGECSCAGKILDTFLNKADSESRRLPNLSAKGVQSMSFNNRVKTRYYNSRTDWKMWMDKGSFEATFSSIWIKTARD